MKKRPTDFSQISLLSNQKAKMIYLKNSKENNEHVKLCKSFELAKHGIRASHGKKKKDLEKRLERHNQDSLKVDDIKSLRKFVGDARDENEFCNQFFEAGRTRRTRSSSVLHNKKGHILTREMSKLEARSSFINDLGKNMESIPNEQSKLQTSFSKQDNTNYSTDVPRMEERESNAGSLAKRGQEAGHSNHTRSCPEETADAQISKTGSPKVQRENIVKQNRNEMLSGLTASSAKPDMIALQSKETVYAEAAASEISDENNNSLEGRICYQEENSSDSENKEEKVYDTEAPTDGDHGESQVSCESKESGNGNTFGQQICEQRKESKKGPVILKRLGPTPNECEEDIEEGTLQNRYLYTTDEKDGATERQYPKERTTSMIQANNVRNSIEKPREIFPVTGNDPPTRRRRSSWAGPRSITERLFKREFPEALPHLGRNYEAGNGVGRPGLDNSDRASLKSFETASNDDSGSTAGEHLMSSRRRTSVCENSEAMKRNIFLQKSNSVPLGLGSRPKIYSEEPFYMRPKKLSRRPSWQPTKLSEDTLKGLQAIADKAKSDNETMTVEPEPESPLVSILPPITLQSIYAQHCSKEKRVQDGLHERKQRGTHRKMEEKEVELDVLAERLKDCRYLRLNKKS